MTKRERLEAIISHYANNRAGDFAKLMGVAPSTISTWKQRDTLDYDMIVAKCEGINPAWLLTGKGEMLLSTSAEEKIEHIDTAQKDKEDVAHQVSYAHQRQLRAPVVSTHTSEYATDIQEIPLYSLEATAGLTLRDDSDSVYELDRIYITNVPRCDAAMIVRGDSMRPLINPGDIVLFKQIHDLSRIVYNQMYLITTDDEGDYIAAVKYIKQSKLGDDYLCLASHNQDFADRDVLKSEVRAVYAIRASIRYNN